MPQQCAGGTTGILVNGRELHVKDLERLMKRGLPTTPNSAYRVEINGNVFDEQSGDFIMSLGKLAPRYVVQRIFLCTLELNVS